MSIPILPDLAHHLAQTREPARPPSTQARVLRTFRHLFCLGLLTAFAGTPASLAQAPVEPEPKQPSSQSEPTSVVPPEGESAGDSWGYTRENEPGTSEDSPAQDATEPERQERTEVVKARLVQPSGHRFVKEVSRVHRDVGRMEWSRQGEWAAFDKTTERGFRGLHVGTLTGGLDRCLTCESWDLRHSHVLAPTWHPSGRMLIAMVQGPAKRLDLDVWDLAGPDRGLHSELWAFTRDGRDAWQITQVVSQGGAVIDPHFSHEGSRLAWAQRVDTTVGGRWGSWQVRVGEFKIKKGLPRLGKVQEIDALPWPGFVSVHGFTDDDKGLWLTATPAPGRRGQEEQVGQEGRRGFLTGRFDLETRTFEPLPTTGNWDALPSGIPRSNRRVWVSDRSIDRPRDAKLPWRGDLWLASDSGRRQERLTYFNDPKSNHYLGEAWIADTSWSPDGEDILLHVLSPDATGAITESLYRVVLDPEIGR